MAPYLIVAAAVALLASLGDFVDKRYSAQKSSGKPRSARTLARSYFDILAVGVLIVFSAVRYEVGTDYPTYYSIYNELDTGDWGSALADAPQEVGFTALMLVTKTLFDSPYAVFWASAVLTVVPIYANLVRRSEFVPLAVALYVLMSYTGSFNAVRQSIAIALLFWASSYLGKSNVRFAIIALWAGTFHASAVFAAVVMLFTFALGWSFRSIVAVCAMGVSASILIQTPLFSSWLEAVNPRYVGYLDSGETGLGAYLQIAAFVTLLLFSTSIDKRTRPLGANDSRLAMLVVVGIVFMIAGTQAVIVFRMGGYFTPFLLLLVSNRVGQMKHGSLAGALVLTGAVLYFAARLMNYGELIPYETYIGPS